MTTENIKEVKFRVLSTLEAYAALGLSAVALTGGSLLIPAGLAALGVSAHVIHSVYKHESRKTQTPAQ